MRGANTFHLTKKKVTCSNTFSILPSKHYTMAQIYSQFEEKSKAPYDNIITNREENLL